MCWTGRKVETRCRSLRWLTTASWRVFQVECSTGVSFASIFLLQKCSFLTDPFLIQVNGIHSSPVSRDQTLPAWHLQDLQMHLNRFFHHNNRLNDPAWLSYKDFV